MWRKNMCEAYIFTPHAKIEIQNSRLTGDLFLEANPRRCYSHQQFAVDAVAPAVLLRSVLSHVTPADACGPVEQGLWIGVPACRSLNHNIGIGRRLVVHTDTNLRRVPHIVHFDRAFARCEYDCIFIKSEPDMHNMRSSIPANGCQLPCSRSLQ